MKKILKQIINSIINFLNKMADQEAERFIELYRQISDNKPNKGGERLKIRGKSYNIGKKKLCTDNG